MKVIKFKLSLAASLDYTTFRSGRAGKRVSLKDSCRRVLLLNLILLGLINLNFSALYGLHFPGFGDKRKDSHAANSGNTGASGAGAAVITSVAVVSERGARPAGAGVIERAGGASMAHGVGGGGAESTVVSDAASDGSRAGESLAGSAVGRASGAGDSGAGSGLGGGWFKSHSDGDLSTLLTRTTARVGILEPKVAELERTQQAHVAAFGKIDNLLVQDDTRIKSLEALKDQVGVLEAKVGLETELAALRNKEIVRHGLKVPVETIADGGPATLYIRLSPDSKRAYELEKASLRLGHEKILERARGPQQDDTHAYDKKFFEDTAAGDVLAAARDKAAVVAQEFTWGRAAAAVAATGLAVWLTKSRPK